MTTAGLIVIVGPAPRRKKRDALAVIVDVILDHRGPVTIEHVVGATGWAFPTAARYLETFAEIGYLAAVSEPQYLERREGGRVPRQYRLGPEALGMARRIMAAEETAQSRQTQRLRPERPPSY